MFTGTEIWKPIPNYEGHYEASNWGRVSSLKYGDRRLMSPHKRSDGRLSIQLHLNNKYKGFRVHQLIASAFLTGYIPLYEINHKDGNPLNNAPDNLEWVTHQENMKHSYDNKLHPRKETHGIAKVTSYQVDKIRRFYAEKRFTQYELADIYGINQPTVSRIIRNKLWEIEETSDVVGIKEIVK